MCKISPLLSPHLCLVKTYSHLYRQKRSTINLYKMFKFSKIAILLTMFTAVIMFAGGCDKEDSSSQNTSYDLDVKDVLGVTGKVTFTEATNSSATIDIVLTNAPEGTHPANLYMYSVVEQGVVVQPLNPVDASGKSSTVINGMSYSELIAYDGCVRVLKSSTEPHLILAQGDVGGNVITDTNKSYTLATEGTYGVSGTALFEKRKNGNTLVTLALTGTISDDLYPAAIHLGSVSSVGGGPVVMTLSHVEGATGKSYTNIRQLNDGTVITYDNWLVYQGYLTIYQMPLLSGTVIAQGNIGSN